MSLIDFFACWSYPRSFLDDEAAQISVELIIIMAAVVAIVLVLVSQLQKTTASGAKKFASKADDVFDKIAKIE